MPPSNRRPPAKRMMLFCEPCGFKRVVEPAEQVADLPEIKTSPIQAKLPTLDPATGKAVHTWAPDPKAGKVDPATGQIDPETIRLVNQQMKPQPKKYKCPRCGRGVKLRELLKPFADALQQRDDDARKRQEEEEKQKRLADGKPPEKKVDPDFLG